MTTFCLQQGQKQASWWGNKVNRPSLLKVHYIPGTLVNGLHNSSNYFPNLFTLQFCSQESKGISEEWENSKENQKSLLQTLTGPEMLSDRMIQTSKLTLLGKLIGSYSLVALSFVFYLIYYLSIGLSKPIQPSQPRLSLCSLEHHPYSLQFSLPLYSLSEHSLGYTIIHFVSSCN